MFNNIFGAAKKKKTIDPKFTMLRSAKYDQVAEAFIGGGWRSFERPMPEIFMKAVNVSAGVIMDVGANTGFYSLLAASISEKNIFSFEPNPEVADILRKNIELNKFQDKIKFFPSAISNFVGDSLLYIPDQSHGCIETSSSLSASFKQNHSSVIEVQSDTIDNFIFKNQRGHINELSIVKIDVEGHEEEVIQGGLRTINEFRPFLFVEILPSANFNNLNHFMKKFDYSDIVLREAGIINSESVYFHSDGWNHVFCPRERIDSLFSLN